MKHTTFGMFFVALIAGLCVLLCLHTCDRMQESTASTEPDVDRYVEALIESSQIPDPPADSSGTEHPVELTPIYCDDTGYAGYPITIYQMQYMGKLYLIVESRWGLGVTQK